MKVCAVSAFRNAAQTIERYCDQMDSLQRALVERGDSLCLVLGYGDSDDGTESILFDECSNRFDAHLLEVSHGGREYGPFEHPQRFKDLATVGNKLWAQIPSTSDVTILVESDLLWYASDMLHLIDDLDDMPVVAPLVLDGPDSFYDTFAFRRGGQRFRKQRPFHADLTLQTTLLEVQSAGSVLVMRSETSRGLTWPDEDVVVGLCEGIRSRGYSIWLDAEVAVHHPLVPVAELIRLRDQL